MTEILTESFCERCGTRYTFETVQQRARPLSRLGTIGRGLKNFVVMPDASLDEAMAVARSDDESRSTSAHLEAFHRTFNFCLTCRQYTCVECWNAVEGRCLTCAPLPVEERAELPQALAAAVIAPVAPAPTATPAPIPILDLPSAEPAAAEEPAVAAADLAAEPVERVEAQPVAEVESELPGASAMVDDSPTQDEPVFAPEPKVESEVRAEPQPEPEPAAAAAPRSDAAGSGAAARDTAARDAESPAVSPLPGFQPGRSLDDEIAAYELRIAALAEAPPEPEPTLQPAAVVRREPRIAGERPSREPLAAVGAAHGAVEAVNAATAEQAGHAALPGACRSCGLSISASARFCRRCGARQES